MSTMEPLVLEHGLDVIRESSGGDWQSHSKIKMARCTICCISFIFSMALGLINRNTLKQHLLKIKKETQL